jgi:hypothetical protein
MEKAASSLHRYVLNNAVMPEYAAFFYFHSINFP